jgi:AcrR family transcriptional regulator
MRVTAETKQATRQEILTAARRLFASQGYEATTTRDISRTAGIAAGTLFNYFPTKEAIVGCLVDEALAKADEEFWVATSIATASLEETLFAYAAIGLRKLRPLRKFLAPTLDCVFSPAVSAGGSGFADDIRTRHLETVGRLLTRHGLADGLSAHALQLYWTLYTGVVAFWTRDDSPKQEDTLALLDESIEMFVTWLTH